VFASCPWSQEGKSTVFCYECDEELLHNPVLLSQDMAAFAPLVRSRGLDEEHKSGDRQKLGARIMLFHEVIAKGIAVLSQDENERDANEGLKTDVKPRGGHSWVLPENDYPRGFMPVRVSLPLWLRWVAAVHSDTEALGYP